jgi:hypothetical protein
MKSSMKSREGHTRVHPPFAQPDPGRRATAQVEDALPPIESFVDDLPSINEFLLPPADGRDEASSPPARAAIEPSQETDAEGWAVGAWQSYDWGGLAALGAPPPEAAQANAAWSSTDWDSAARAGRDPGQRSSYVASDDVAAALDEIARRIRSKEISLDQFKGTPPEAAIAAAFAALLKSKR